MKRARSLTLALALTACSSAAPRRAFIARPAPVVAERAAPAPAPVTPARARESPPVPGPPREVHLPAIARRTLANGLELNVVERPALPVVHLRLVVRGAGSAADPPAVPGLATFVGDMLREGTQAHSSLEVAEDFALAGGALEVTTSQDETTLACTVLRERVSEALSLLAELVSQPAFTDDELGKLRRREIDRLTQEQQDPTWLARRSFVAAVYGAAHPYGHTDTTADALQRITRAPLTAFHRGHYTASAMFLVAVGDVTAAEFTPLAARALARVRAGSAVAAPPPAPPASASRTVILVDRPGSQQSEIRIGNASLARASDDYVPLAVANQVLGGDASSRLFMDLRERRSLTYGAYSRVTAYVGPGTFSAGGAVETAHTGEALRAFFEHLERIAREAPSDEETRAARAYLTDAFALTMATPADLGRLVADLRLHGLPDAYWDHYRAAIAAVTPAQALTSAQRYIRPASAVVVLVGVASALERDAQRLGPVRVVDLAGRTLRELPAQP